MRLSGKETIKEGKGVNLKVRNMVLMRIRFFFYTKTDNFKLKNMVSLSNEKFLKKFNKTDKKGKKYYLGIPLSCSKSMGQDLVCVLDGEDLKTHILLDGDFRKKDWKKNIIKEILLLRKMGN